MKPEKEEVLTDKMLNKLKGIGLEKELTALCIHIRDTQREAGKSETIKQVLEICLEWARRCAKSKEIDIDELKSKLGELKKEQSSGDKK